MDMTEPIVPSGGSYQRLLVWQKSIDLIDLIYAQSASWPASEMYGLISQVRRAAVSIAANIAEGSGRTGKREYAHHVSIARGSLHEVETLLIVADRLGYCTSETTKNLLFQLAEIGRMLTGLIRSLTSTER
jgi:four helix bundle protein